GGPDKCLAFLINDGAGLPGMSVDVDQAKALMTAVRLLVGEMLTVFVPAKSGKAEINLIDLGLNLLLFGDVKKIQLIRRELVARKRIGPRRHLGPAPSWRR